MKFRIIKTLDCSWGSQPDTVKYNVQYYDASAENKAYGPWYHCGTRFSYEDAEAFAKKFAQEHKVTELSL